MCRCHLLGLTDSSLRNSAEISGLSVLVITELIEGIRIGIEVHRGFLSHCSLGVYSISIKPNQARRASGRDAPTAKTRLSTTTYDCSFLFLRFPSFSLSISRTDGFFILDFLFLSALFQYFLLLFAVEHWPTLFAFQRLLANRVATRGACMA